MPAFRARRAALDVAALAALLSLAAACAHRQPAPAEHAEHTAAAAPASATIAAGATTAAAASASAAGQDTALPASAATAEARLASSTRHGEYAMIFTGPNPTDSVRAWVVYPERKTKAPVVIVIHEIFGLSSWVRSVADQLAADGFIAIAPDLLTGKPLPGAPDSVPTDSIVAAIRTLDPAAVSRQVSAAAQYGMSLPAALPRYGVVGFCWGGAMVFHHAARAPALNAGVAYYGSAPVQQTNLANTKAPVLALYGENDARVNATIPAADSVFGAARVSFEKEIFSGAGHGFLRQQDAQNGANLAATRAAWPRTLAFFRKHLGA
jgi:carboxymethylenebutenolidase